MSGAVVPRVTVVGLGPAGPGLMGSDARSLLGSDRPRFLRTARHPAAAAFAGLPSFDQHYEAADTFDEVYERIVEDLVAAARTAGEVVYAVPGSPLVAERTVELLRADERVSVEVVPALSFLDLAWDRVGVDPLAAGVRLVDGTRFGVEAAGERGPLLVAQCWSSDVLSAVKLAVDNDAAHLPPVTILHHLGLEDEEVRTVAWDDLDRAFRPDHLTSVWIPELASPVAAEVAALVELVRTLRERCPWDRQQTHGSLSPHALEEAYEVADAIAELERTERSAADEASAVAHLEEELGDLLFQVVFHARLGAEEGRFDLADVARGVHDKLVARHPHVFGDVVATTPGAVVSNWEAIKQAEKGRSSVTEGIPTALPALSLATKLLSKAKAVGLPVSTLEEDRRRLSDAVAALGASGGDAGQAGEAGEGDRLGDVLLAVARVARHLGTDPEAALRQAALGLRDRIVAAEQIAAAEQEASGIG